MNAEREYHRSESLKYTIQILHSEIEWMDYTHTSLDNNRISISGTPYYIEFMADAGWHIFADRGFDGYERICITPYITEVIDTVRYLNGTNTRDDS